MAYASNIAEAGGNYVMVAAIDFGTTFSGYAFSFKTNPEAIHMNKNWGETVGCQSYKTPSCVLTGPRGEFIAFGHEAEDRYGQLIEEDDDEENYNLYRNFKMVLHNKQNLSTKTSISAMNGTIRPAVDIFSMSLKYLKDHLLAALDKQFKGKSDTELIRWVITVPAIWTEEAKQFMREAAVRAGCIRSRDSKKLIIALEPEAASLYCRGLPISQFVDADTSHNLSFTTGTKYLVVDAGGGTVDVTAHEMAVDGKIKEIHMANGGAMGGIKVDEQFKKLLCKVLGADFINSYKKEVPQQWFALMTMFEKVKRSFKPDGKSKLNIMLGYSMGTKYQEKNRSSIEAKIKDSKDLGVVFRNGCLIISHEAAINLYASVVEGITEHVKSLLSLPKLSSVSYVLLVGGFGESLYLQERLSKSLRRNITMLVPSEAQLAVIKGAVLFGHNPGTIACRVSPKTYGISVMKAFKEGIHEEARRETIHGKDWCKNILELIVLKGQVIEVGKVEERRRVPHKPNQKKMVIRLYSLDRSELAQVEYIDSPEMCKLGVANISMPNVDKGMDRAVLVHVILGGTEIQVSATDVSSGNKVDATIDMLADM